MVQQQRGQCDIRHSKVNQGAVIYVRARHRAGTAHQALPEHLAAYTLRVERMILSIRALLLWHPGANALSYHSENMLGAQPPGDERDQS
jgi:hypothetical protein